MEFDEVVAMQIKLDDELAKIDVTTSNADDKTVFYTSLYHSMFSPSVFNDVNGEYRGSDGKVYKDELY